MVAGSRLLRRFIAEHGLTPTAAARAIGVSHVTIFSYLAGTKRPECDRREAIDRWTDGAVPSDSWRTPKERLELNRVQPLATGTDDATGKGE